MPKCTQCNAMNHTDALICKKCDRVLPISNGYTCPKCQTVNGPFRDTCKSCNLDMRSLKSQESRVKSKRKANGGFFSRVIQAVKYITVLICMLILGCFLYYFVS